MPITTAIPDALDELKTLTLAIDPSPYDKALSAFAYPKDYADINVANPALPMIITGKARASGTIVKYTWNASIHRWLAIVEIFMCESARMNDQLAAQQEIESWGWVEKMEEALRADPTINGSVHTLGHSQDGEPDVRIEYEYGELGLFKRDFYGLHMEIPVIQMV